MKNRYRIAIASLGLLGPAAVLAAEVTIPRGTVVFGELDERVTSNERKFRVGYEVDGHVWKDVTVEGHTVIRAGTPLALRIRRLDGTNVGGGGGSIEIMAVSVKAVDGSDISLTGGYGDKGNDRYGLSRALSILLWPAAFLPGRKAELDVGTVFDASIPADTRIKLPDGSVPTLTLPPERPDLLVSIVYDEINPKTEALPLELTLCHREFTRDAHVTAVNEAAVKPILVAINVAKRGADCHEYRGRVNLESLRKHFKPGINRFTVSMGGVQASVVLNVEM